MKKIPAACAAFVLALGARAYDVVATVSVDDGERWFFDIELADNEVPFTAFQMEIELEGGVHLKQQDLTEGGLMNGHTLQVLKAKGCYKVICYSMSNNPLRATEGRLFGFSVDGDLSGITIKRIIFVRNDGTEEEASAYVRPLNRSEEDGVGQVQAGEGVQQAVYDMSGRQVYRIDRRGIFIRNGRKQLR